MTVLDKPDTVARESQVGAVIAATPWADLPAPLRLLACGVELLDKAGVEAHMRRWERQVKAVMWTPFALCVLLLGGCRVAATVWTTYTLEQHQHKVQILGFITLIAVIAAIFTLLFGLFSNVSWEPETVTSATKLPECAADLPAKVRKAMGIRGANMVVLSLKADPVLCIDVVGGERLYGKVWGGDGAPVTTIAPMDLSPFLQTP